MYMYMEDSNRAENRPIKLDWDKLLPPDSTDDQPPAVVIVGVKTPRGGATDTPAAKATAMDDHLSYHELLERIQSTKKSISVMGPKLPDKGDKLRDSLARLEAERDKRDLAAPRVETINIEESDGFDKPARSLSPEATGSKDSRRENATSQDSFATILLKRFDKTDRGSNAFDKEFSLLGRCDQPKTRSINELSQKRKLGVGQSTSRRSPPKRHQHFSRERGKQVLSNGNENGRASTRCANIREAFSNLWSKDKKDTLPISTSNDSKPKKGVTIVLEDEEDPQLLETLEQLEKPDESMKDVRIYYPSREHPESVEISYTDFDCLAPQAFLKSNIMNFYIRYVQEHISPTNCVMRNCHFFNTYFYHKLKEVLSSKESSRDEFFIKFRRWWKGVNIFHKEYILIPINEDLVIICIPDKEEALGPIILHLDSLGLHSSQSVFQNIKSYLVEEWKHLCSEASYSDLPFADHVWEKLSRNIKDNCITVPQQKNDYDCGLFVLYFMERFIEDAPGRLKKKDLAMFGKQWFKPEEASGLRVKIHKLLMQEFKKAKNATDENSSQSSSPSVLHDVVEV